MRVYLIRRKGAANTWYNILTSREITFSDGNKIYTGLLFLRKKDAKAYLKTLLYPELYEVVGATVDS